MESKAGKTGPTGETTNANVLPLASVAWAKVATDYVRKVYDSTFRYATLGLDTGFAHARQSRPSNATTRLNLNNYASGRATLRVF